MSNPVQVLGLVEAGRVSELGARSDRKAFRRAARLLHPDTAVANGIDRARANAAFEIVNAWFNHRQTSSPIILTTRRSSYSLGDVIGTGSLATLYAGKAGDGSQVAVKMFRKPAHAPYADAEKDVLTELAETVKKWTFLDGYYPRLVDSFRHKETGGSVQRRVNVLDAFTAGWYTLAQVKASYPQGLDGRDWAWMHRRLVIAVGGIGAAGWVHGAILPENVLINPALHGLVIVGFSCAVRSGSAPRAVVASQRDLYAPEALAKEPLTPATDMFMAHSLMRFMLHPSQRRQLAFADGCSQTTPGYRPDAASVAIEYDELVRELYGPRKFRPFAMPTGTAA